MAGKIHAYLADDHRRLDGLLDRVISDSGTIDAAAYGQFRAGLLKHIAMEEKIILPAAQKQRGGAALPVAAKATTGSRRVNRVARADADGASGRRDSGNSQAPQSARRRSRRHVRSVRRIGGSRCRADFAAVAQCTGCKSGAQCRWPAYHRRRAPGIGKSRLRLRAITESRPRYICDHERR